MGRAGRGSACCGQLHGSGGREADLAHPGERVEEPHAASVLAAAARRGEARDKGREASSSLKEGERQAPASPPWVRHSRHPAQSLELQGRGGSLPRRACFP